MMQPGLTTCLPAATLYPNFVKVKILRFFDINICNV